MNREDALTQASEKIQQKKVLFLQLPTGYGKTAIALKMCRPGNILAIVPQVNLLQNFQLDKEKWEIPCGHITSVCNKSLHIYSDQTFTNIIWDECDTITNNLLESLKEINYEWLICCSAYAEKDKKKLLRKLGVSLANTVTCTIEEAIDAGVIPPFKLNVHYIKLDNTDNIEVEYTVKTGKDKGKKKSFKTSEQKQYEYNDNNASNIVAKIIAYNIKNQDDINFKQINRSKLAFDPAYRKSIDDSFIRSLGFNLAKFWKGRISTIYNSKSKQKKALELYNKNKRQIFFFKTQKSADKFAKFIKVKAYHSGNTDKVNREILEQFNEEVTNTFVCVKAMDRGGNLYNVEEAILVQIESSKTSFIQRIGRNLRWADAQEKIIHCILAKDTQDEQWFKNANVVNENRIHVHEEEIL